jgi:putative flippase GtrA
VNLKISHLVQPMTFLAVGASSAALYFLLLWAMQPWIAGTILLTAVCYTVSMAYNFLLQSALTFRSAAPDRKNVLRFVIMHLAALSLNSLSMWGLVDGLSLPLIASQLLVTASITVFVFLASKHWVYRTGPAGD